MSHKSFSSTLLLLVYPCRESYATASALQLIPTRPVKISSTARPLPGRDWEDSRDTITLHGVTQIGRQRHVFRGSIRRMPHYENIYSLSPNER